MGRHPGLPPRGLRVGRRRGHRGRGALGVPGPRRGVQPQRHQDLRRLGRVGRDRRRLRAHRGDDPVPLAARHPQLVHDPRLPGQPPAEQGRVAAAVEGHEPARRGRRGVRVGPALLRPSRRGPRAAHRHGTHQRPTRGQPRAHGHRRGPAHRHLPLAVRLRRRRGHRQPPAARRRSPTPGSSSGRSCRRSTSPRSRRASPRCRSFGPSSHRTSWSGSTGCGPSPPTCTGTSTPPRSSTPGRRSRCASGATPPS